MKTVRAALCFSILSVLALLVGGTWAEETKLHRVHQGDTLWDISASELKDPFLWPAIWESNPHINNPDLIFPDQELRLPTAEELATRQGTPSTAPMPVEDADMAGKPVMAGDTADDAEATLKRWETARSTDTGPKFLNIHHPIGVVTNEIPCQGRIVGTIVGKSFAGDSDQVILDLPGAAPGQRFGVYRDAGAVRYPGSWEFSDEAIGHIVLEVGIIEVREEKGGRLYGFVERAYLEIMSGDLLGDLPELPQVTKDFTEPVNSRVEGRVIGLRDLNNLGGKEDIAYLDIGANDGIEPGNKLWIFDAEKNQYLGDLVILRVTPSTATALLYRTTEEVRAGFRVTAPM